MRALPIVLGLSLFTGDASAQTLDWLATIASSGANNSHRVEADREHNVISAGMAPGVVVLSPGGSYSFVLGPPRYVYKLGPERDFLWLARMEDAAGGTALAIDQNDEVFMGSGARFPVTYLTPAIGETLSVFSNGSASPALLWKLGSDGSTRWLRQFESSSGASVITLAARRDGGIIAAGRFKGTIHLDSAPRSHVLTSLGGYDVFVVALDADGGFQWARQIGGVADDLPTAIASTADGGSVLSGTFGADITVADNDNPVSVTCAGGLDGFLVRYGATGMLRNAGSIGGSGDDTIRDVDTDPSGKVAIAGAFSTVADLDPGPAEDGHASSGEDDVFVSLVDENGRATWTHTYGDGGNDIANAVRLGSGKVYIGGTFADSVDFAPDAGGQIVTAIGAEDGFVLRLHRDGGFDRVFTYGGDSLLDGSDRVYDLSLDSRGALLVAGGYAGYVDFDPSPDDEYIAVNDSSFSDGYVWKLEDAGALMASNGIASSLALGQVSDVHITITSTLDFDLADLSIEQDLPASLRVASVAMPATTCGGTVSAPAGAAHFSLAGGHLAAGETCSVSVVVVAAATGEASLETTPAAFGNDQEVWPLATAVTPFDVGPAASVVQWAVHEPIASTIGQAVTFGVDVVSHGEEFAVPGGSITVSGGETSCVIELPASTCVLAFAEIGTYEVTADYSGDGNFLPSQSATSHDVLASADIAMTISGAPAAWPIGTEVGFNLVVTNAGPDDAGEIAVSAPMTPFASASWTCISGCDASGDGDVAFTLALGVGEVATIHVQARVPDSADASLTVTAAATPGSLVLDSNTDDNVASHTAPLALFRDGFD